MERPSLRPRRVGEVLEAAIKLYLGNARVLFGAAVIVVVPLEILAAIVLASIYSSGQDVTTSFASLGHTVTPGVAGARLGASAILGLDSLIATTLTLAACVKAISDAYLGQPVGIGESLTFALRRLLPLIALDILYALGLVVGFVLLVIPGIWLYCAWSVCIPALLLEHRGPLSALGRSRRLVKGRWWPTAGALLLGYVVTLVIGGAIEAGLTGVLLSHSNPSVLLAVTVSALAAIVSGVLLQPFTAAVITVLYHDLRIRHEGGETGAALSGQVRPQDVGRPGGPPFWPPPPGWQPD